MKCRSQPKPPFGLTSEMEPGVGTKMLSTKEMLLRTRQMLLTRLWFLFRDTRDTLSDAKKTLLTKNPLLKM